MSPLPLERPRAVILDLDGTLLDSREMWFAMMCEVATHLGVPMLSRAMFDRTFGQSTAADVELYYPGATEQQLDRLFATLWVHHAHLVRPMPHARELLTALKAAAIPYACATNSCRDLALGALAAGRLAVPIVACANEVPRPKPAPDVLLLAAQRLSVAIESCVMIGDTAFDQQSAAAAGCGFIGLGVPGDVTVISLGELIERWGLMS